VEQHLLVHRLIGRLSLSTRGATGARSTTGTTCATGATSWT